MPASSPPIPIIDISPLVAGDTAGERAAARRIGEACREIGFFYITGHGVEPALRAHVFSAAAKFFNGPAHIKDAAAFTGPGGNRGFIRLGGEALDPGTPPM